VRGAGRDSGRPDENPKKKREDRAKILAGGHVFLGQQPSAVSPDHPVKC